MRARRIEVGSIAVFIVWVMILFLLTACNAKEPESKLKAEVLPQAAPTAEAIGGALQARSKLPPDAEKWRRELTRSARLEWGLNAPIAMFGAQVHQESGWRADAVSPVGAQGIAQFMPATATWLSGVRSTIGPADPFNPVWALRALTAYDKEIWDDVRALNDCNRAGKMLSGYNGGPGWVTRDEALAVRSGLNANVWWDSVEVVNAGRNEAAWKENRQYPKRILRELEPKYLAAGWKGGLCNSV